jgi:hypothetical protein
MKNEEKAKEIGNIMLELANYSSYNTPDEQRNNIRNVAERAALKMAQWKDAQYAELLAKIAERNEESKRVARQISDNLKQMLKINNQ